jgi:MFS family permease
LLIMGIGTALIGVLPTYAVIGVLAPVLLTILRGSVERRGFMASWPQMGVPLGLLLSTLLVQVTSTATGPDFETWGWRVPFLVSLLLVGVGLYVRLRVLESPEFAAVRQREDVVKRPLAEVLRTQWREVLVSAFVRLSEQAPFYLFITFVLTYGTKQLELSRSSLLTATMIAATIGLVSVPLFGHLSDVIGRRRMYGIGIVCTGLFAFPYFALLNTRASGLVLLAIVLSLVFHDMQYGPQAALIAESFGTNVRYSGAGLGYQLASVIAGGPAPLIAAAILKTTGSSNGIAWYIVICAVIAMVALVLMPRRPRVDAADPHLILSRRRGYRGRPRPSSRAISHVDVPQARRAVVAPGGEYGSGRGEAKDPDRRVMPQDVDGLTARHVDHVHPRTGGERDTGPDRVEGDGRRVGHRDSEDLLARGDIPHGHVPGARGSQARTPRADGHAAHRVVAGQREPVDPSVRGMPHPHHRLRVTQYGVADPLPEAAMPGAGTAAVGTQCRELGERTGPRGVPGDVHGAEGVRRSERCVPPDDTEPGTVPPSASASGQGRTRRRLDRPHAYVRPDERHEKGPVDVDRGGLTHARRSGVDPDLRHADEQGVPDLEALVVLRREQFEGRNQHQVDGIGRAVQPAHLLPRLRVPDRETAGRVGHGQFLAPRRDVDGDHRSLVADAQQLGARFRLLRPADPEGPLGRRHSGRRHSGPRRHVGRRRRGAAVGALREPTENLHQPPCFRREPARRQLPRLPPGERLQPAR